MLELNISNQIKIVLDFDEKEIQRFSMCKFYIVSGNLYNEMDEDFLYWFVECMLGRLNNIPNIKNTESLGKLGKWQEHYYYDDNYNKLHSEEITQSDNATFVATEQYGTFLYRCKETVWFEVDKVYDESCGMSPVEYYNDHNNYRIMLLSLPEDTLNEWKKQLTNIWLYVKIEKIV